MSKQTRLVKNTVVIAVGNVFMKLISFFMLPLYTAVLTTSEYGTVDFVMVTGSLLFNVLCLQLQKGLFRLLVEARENKEQICRVCSSTYLFLILFVGFFSLVVLLVKPLIGYEYILFILAHAVLAVFSDHSLHAARGLGDNTTYTIASCANGSINVLLNVLFVAIFRFGVKGMLCAELIASCVSISYPFIRLRLWRFVAPKWFDKEILRQLMRFSLPLIPYVVCWWLISAFGRIQINLILGAAAAGIYAVANKFPSTFTLATNIFYTAWSESAAENVDDSERNTYYQNIMDRAIKFYSSVNLGVIAIMPLVFPILINANYSEAQYYIPVMMTAALLQGISNLFGSVYTALKRTKEIAITTIGATVLSIVSNMVLIPVIGLYAAALSLLGAHGLIALVQYFGVRKMVKYRLSPEYLLRETLVYVLVLVAYYSGIIWVQALVLLCVAIYCLLSNWSTIKGIVEFVTRKVKKSR